MMHGRNNGKKLMAVRIIKHAMEIIHLLTDLNPIQVIVDAVINRYVRVLRTSFFCVDGFALGFNCRWVVCAGVINCRLLSWYCLPFVDLYYWIPTLIFQVWYHRFELVLILIFMLAVAVCLPWFGEWNDDYCFPIGLIASMMAFCISSIWPFSSSPCFFLFCYF